MSHASYVFNLAEAVAQIALTLEYITVSFFHPSPMYYAMSNVFTFIYLDFPLSKSSNRV